MKPFTSEHCIQILELMIKQLDDDVMTDALRDIVTGGNAHGPHLAKWALQTAVEEMKAVERLVADIKHDPK